jgi:threonine aldolase
MFGGAMRQVGIYAAAGLYALDHHRTRLVEDHANARRIATALVQHPRVDLELSSAQTNIIVFRLRAEAPEAAVVVARARERGVLLFPFGTRTLRAVTHLDVSAGQCERAAAILCDII